MPVGSGLRRLSSRFLDEDEEDAELLLDQVVPGDTSAPQRPAPGAAAPLHGQHLGVGSPLNPLRPTSQISWADGVSEDDDYFASLAASRASGTPRGSASTCF
ncbi:uncharacterized protein LOC117645958 [Thrips palmi]|uniref:Uncharacterized protein LOC117645958 n=1 Tax=Thrips palmi TaxID=161013 RepID=A0A6P8YQY7_THRPL|nr:uncharacterized protein LOC117645958 [Thrips palmi]